MLARRALVWPLLLLGCSRSSPPAAADSSSTGPTEVVAAAPAPGAAPTPAPTPEPAQVATPAPEAPAAAVKEASELPPGDGSSPTPLSPDGETVVDPASRFRVVLAGASRDARLLLLDATGAAVPASEATEVGAATTLTLAPSTALTPGSRYQLRLDGAVGRELHLGDKGYPPSRYALRAAGEPPPSQAKAAPKRKRRR
jgi:hypothetical protein